MIFLRYLGFLRLLVIAILLSGCATPATVPVALNPKANHLPIVSKIPLSVGIYFSPEFRFHKHEFAHPFEYSFQCTFEGPVLPIGQASILLFEASFSRMFDKTVTLESHSTLLSSTASPSLVIEPDIEKVECPVPDIGEPVRILIIYYFALYSPAGDVLEYWSVTGKGESTRACLDLHTPERESCIGKATDLAIEDAANKIAIEFQNIPVVQRFLQEKIQLPGNLRRT